MLCALSRSLVQFSSGDKVEDKKTVQNAIKAVLMAGTLTCSTVGISGEMIAQNSSGTLKVQLKSKALQNLFQSEPQCKNGSCTNGDQHMKVIVPDSDQHMKSIIIF